MMHSPDFWRGLRRPPIDRPSFLGELAAFVIVVALVGGAIFMLADQA